MKIEELRSSVLNLGTNYEQPIAMTACAALLGEAVAACDDVIRNAELKAVAPEPKPKLPPVDPRIHHVEFYSYSDQTITLQDGSSWKVYSHHMDIVSSWSQDDELSISYTGYNLGNGGPFQIYNRNKKDRIYVSDICGPNTNGPHARWIVSIDYKNKNICLNDGTIWNVKLASADFLKFAVNDSITVASQGNNAILINHSFEKFINVDPVFNFCTNDPCVDVNKIINHSPFANNVEYFSLNENIIRLKDGSSWKVYSYHMNQVTSWSSDDVLSISYTGYNLGNGGPYRIYNRTRYEWIDLNLIGLEARGSDTRYIQSIDPDRNRIYLDDRTCWNLKILDANFCKFSVGDPVVCLKGGNSGCDALLLNYNLKSFLNMDRVPVNS